MDKPDLSNLEKALSEFKKLKEINAAHADPQMEDMMRSIYSSIDYCYQEIRRVSNSFYDYASQHSMGHIPPLKGAGQMNKALKVLGLDGDYQTSKQEIYASSDETFAVSWTKPLRTTSENII